MKSDGRVVGDVAGPRRPRRRDPTPESARPDRSRIRAARLRRASRGAAARPSPPPSRRVRARRDRSAGARSRGARCWIQATTACTSATARAGRQPPARVARRRAVAAQVDGIDVEPGVGERVHEGPPLALDLQIEVRQAAPRPAVHQHDRRARLRRLLLPHGQVVAVDDDVVLDRRPRRRLRVAASDSDQRRRTQRQAPSTQHRAPIATPSTALVPAGCRRAARSSSRARRRRARPGSGGRGQACRSRSTSL